jgi:hypothetical protein
MKADTRGALGISRRNFRVFGYLLSGIYDGKLTRSFCARFCCTTASSFDIHKEGPYPGGFPLSEEKVTTDGSKAGNDGGKFEWVAERSACSLPKTFLALRGQVEADVKARNGLRPKNSPYEFLVEDKDADYMVVLKAEGARQAVTFSLAEHAILVRNDRGDLMFEITVAFRDDGQCRLAVNEKERDSWQVRRMALEELMFQGH